MKAGLFTLENYFNKLINFEDLKIKTKEYLEQLIQDDKSIIFEDCTEDEIRIIKESTIEYGDTCIFINNASGFPFFRIKYNLYSPKNNMPNFIYEVEYNVDGEFLDEYFLEI